MGSQRLPSLDRIVVDQLREQAILRNISPVALASALLDIIVRDGLCEAVLDDSFGLVDCAERVIEPRV